MIITVDRPMVRIVIECVSIGSDRIYSVCVVADSYIMKDRSRHSVGVYGEFDTYNRLPFLGLFMCIIRIRLLLLFIVATQRRDRI